MGLKKPEIRVGGRKEVKDKAGRELSHVSLFQKFGIHLWLAAISIFILNQQLPVLFNSKFKTRKTIKIYLQDFILLDSPGKTAFVVSQKKIGLCRFLSRKSVLFSLVFCIIKSSVHHNKDNVKR